MRADEEEPASLLEPPLGEDRHVVPTSFVVVIRCRCRRAVLLMGTDCLSKV